jgi:hypothetical protein
VSAGASQTAAYAAASSSALLSTSTLQTRQHAHWSTQYLLCLLPYSAGNGLWTQSPPSCKHTTKTPTYTCQHVSESCVKMSQHTFSTFCVRCPTALATDYGPNPWRNIRQAAGLPRAVSGCPLTKLLARFRGQQLQRCRPLLEVLLSTFLIEPPRPLAAHQVHGSCSHL